MRERFPNVGITVLLAALSVNCCLLVQSVCEAVRTLTSAPVSTRKFSLVEGSKIMKRRLLERPATLVATNGWPGSFPLEKNRAVDTA